MALPISPRVPLDEESDDSDTEDPPAPGVLSNKAAVVDNAALSEAHAVRAALRDALCAASRAKGILDKVRPELLVQTLSLLALDDSDRSLLAAAAPQQRVESTESQLTGPGTTHSAGGQKRAARAFPEEVGAACASSSRVRHEE